MAISKKTFKIISVACIAGAVGFGYAGGLTESGVIGLVGVGFGVVTALIAVFKS